MDDEEITQTVTIHYWDYMRQGVNILFGDYINMNDLEVCGHLSDSDILSSVRRTQSSDEKEEQECIEPPLPIPRLHKLKNILMNWGDLLKINQRSVMTYSML